MSKDVLYCNMLSARCVKGKKRKKNADEDTDETFVESQTRFCSSFIIWCLPCLVLVYASLIFGNTRQTIMKVCYHVLCIELLPRAQLI